MGQPTREWMQEMTEKSSLKILKKKGKGGKKKQYKRKPITDKQQKYSLNARQIR